MIAYRTVTGKFNLAQLMGLLSQWMLQPMAIYGSQGLSARLQEHFGGKQHVTWIIRRQKEPVGAATWAINKRSERAKPFRCGPF